MGFDLIAAMVIATLVTRAWEQSKRRAGAQWEAARRDAEERRQARAAERERTAKGRRKRFEAARKAGPSDPLWWAWASGRLIVGGIAAGGAALVGAVEGVRAGVPEGYRIGKQRSAARTARWRARAAWLRERAAWRNGRRAGMADGRQAAEDEQAAEAAARAAQRPAPVDTEQCPTCGVFAEVGEGHVCGATRADGPEETTDGPELTVYLPLTAAGEIHGAGVHRPWIATDLADAQRGDRPPGTPAFRDPETAQRWAEQQHGPQGWAGLARVMTPVINRPGEERPVISGRAMADAYAAAAPIRRQHAAQQPSTGSEQEPVEIVDGEIVDEEPAPPPIGRSLPMPGETAVSPQRQLNVNGLDVSGGDGEGYASTITAMDTLAKLLAEVTEVTSDLRDVLEGRQIDGTTLQMLAELYDHTDAAASGAEQVRNHAQEMHEPIAAAVAGAGGSPNVAQTDFYDHV